MAKSKFILDGAQPRASAPYANDQKNPLFRKELKKWRERGFSRELSRIVAKCSYKGPKRMAMRDMEEGDE